MRPLLLTLTTCLIVLPTYAQYSGGTGEPNDPYQIATAADLITLGEEPNDYDKHFILTADIDLDPNLPGRKVFDKAVIDHFAGVFDGQGHTISHLTIRGGSYLGLFGQEGGRVCDLGLEAVDINGSGREIGGLVGWATGDINKCYSTGKVSGSRFIGGLVGIQGGGTIAQCYSAVVVSGTTSVGGLVGTTGTKVSECYSTGTVSGELYIGGLVGRNEFHGYLTDCYSTGEVNGASHFGGLVGENVSRVIQCYSTGIVRGNEYVGLGLIGSGIGWGPGYGTILVGSVTKSFWDTQTSGLSGSAGGIGLTTAEMMDPYMLSLNGFAKDPNWVLEAGRDYPRLAWEATPGEIIPERDIDWLVGDGTPEAPYQIETTEQLILLGKASILCDKYSILTADVDLDPNLPVGRIFAQAVIPTFTGSFDGNGHTISNLAIQGASYPALFGHLMPGGEVSNLGVVDANITGSGNCVGGFVAENRGTLTCCYTSGTVRGNYYVGGLVGFNYRGDVMQCYNTCAVSGHREVGGMVGWNLGAVIQCFSTGIVTGNDNVGGLVGNNREYYPVGSVDTSFWDIQTSGWVTSAGGIGKTTAEMQTAGTFLEVGWDFVGETANGTDDIWWILEGQDYPRLWWEPHN